MYRDFYLTAPKKLGKAIDIYLGASKDVSVSGKTNTAIRIWVAGHGGPMRSGRRVTDREKLEIDNFIQELDFDKFWVKDPLEVQNSGFRKLSIGKRSQSTYRNSLRLLISFCQANEWDPRQQSKVKYLRRRSLNGSRRKQCKRKNWQRADKIQLTERESPPDLNAEMRAFKEYCLEKLETSDIAYYEGFIRRYLGMLHERGMPLEEITLTKLIPYARSCESITMTEVANGQLYANQPVIKAALEAGRFYEAWAVAKEIAREQEKAAVKHVEDLVESYGQYTKSLSISRKVEVTWLIRLTRFIYRNDFQDLDDYSENPIVKALRKRNGKLKKRAKRETPRVTYEEKSLTRNQVLGLIHILKGLALQEKGAEGKHTLSIGFRALNIQTFLVTGLLSLIPPRRFRVLRELEINRTFCKGLRIDKRFVAEKDLPDSAEAQWYYYLGSEDYKTGRFKGASWTPIPNWEFNDGTTFYEYIDLWLTQIRPKLNPSCSNFFVSTGCTRSIPGTITGIATIRMWVKRATLEHTDVEVAPKEFRKMFVSYVKSLPDITESELDAIAAAMGHSRQMQEQVYNQLGHDETVSPVINFQKRINESYLEGIG